jgi:hypothetical protein
MPHVNLRYEASICLEGLSLQAEQLKYRTEVSVVTRECINHIFVHMLHRFHVLENGTLLVQEVHMTDSGKYGCTAGNSGGFKREEVTLIVRSE